VLEEECVDIYPKRTTSSTYLKSCCISVYCDEDGGCRYGIWVNTKDIKFGSRTNNYKVIHTFSEQHGFTESSNFFYEEDVLPKLTQKTLYDQAKADSAGADKPSSADTLSSAVVAFITESKVREVLLQLK